MADRGAGVFENSVSRKLSVPSLQAKSTYGVGNLRSFSFGAAVLALLLHPAPHLSSLSLLNSNPGLPCSLNANGTSRGGRSRARDGVGGRKEGRAQRDRGQRCLVGGLCKESSQLMSFYSLYVQQYPQDRKSVV